MFLKLLKNSHTPENFASTSYYISWIPERLISRCSSFTSSIEIQKNKSSDHKNNFKVIRLPKVSFRVYYLHHNVQRTQCFPVANTWCNLLMMYMERIANLVLFIFEKCRIVSITNLTNLKNSTWSFWVSWNT